MPEGTRHPRQRYFFRRDRPFVSPDRRRCLLTVAAAIRFATFALRPRLVADSLIFSYWRFRLLLFTPRGGMCPPCPNARLLQD
jgi:hypothetical protein